jgi:anti-sigma factor RsiW
MKCREVRKALVAYLDGEIMPSERTLVDAHLAGCDSCARELATLGSSRRTLAGSLKTMAAQAIPSPQAWIHLQASLAEEARSNKKTTRFLRKGDRPMRLRWRIALSAAGTLVLAVAVIAAVPESRAAAGDFLAESWSRRAVTTAVRCPRARPLQ